MSHMRWIAIWTFHLKCHMVCWSVILLCYRVACLWFWNKRFCNKKGALFVLDPVYVCVYIHIHTHAYIDYVYHIYYICLHMFYIIYHISYTIYHATYNISCISYNNYWKVLSKTFHFSYNLLILINY